MKNIILSLLLVFLVFGMFLPIGLVLANDDDSDNSGSGNGNSHSDDGDDDRSGRTRIERNVEIEDGITRIEIRRRFVDADGNEVKERIVIVAEKEDKGMMIRKFKAKREIEGAEEFEVETEMEIEEEVENNRSRFKAKLSNGNFTFVDILPEEAHEIARQRLRSRNFTRFELKEVVHKNIPRVVYNVETNQHGRFLGIFKLAMRAEVEIDPETGDIISLSRPWWAFLVTVPEEPEEPEEPGNETENNVPVITSNPVTIVDENSSYEYQVTATDADNDTLTYFLTEHPEWISINSTDGLVSGTSPVVENSTDYTISINISDEIDFDTQEYNLTVNNIA